MPGVLWRIKMDGCSGSAEDKKIYDLTEVYEDNNGSGLKLSDSRNNQEVIVVDGRGYERVTRDNNIHNLADVVEDTNSSNKLNEEIIKRATEIAERIAREIMPEIAARVIREEIEKIKKLSDKGSANR
jgi:carbon monoxide dehydrogenase subunit G